MNRRLKLAVRIVLFVLLLGVALVCFALDGLWCWLRSGSREREWEAPGG